MTFIPSNGRAALALGVALALALTGCAPAVTPSPRPSTPSLPTSGTGMYFRQVFIAESMPEPTPSASPNQRPLPELPTPKPTPRPTAAAIPLPSLADRLAWRPSNQDIAEYVAYQSCADPSPTPDLPDQPLITCALNGSVRFLLGPALLLGEDIIDAQAAIPNNSIQWIVTVTFNEQGTADLAAVTAELPKFTAPSNEMAIVFNSVVLAAPVVGGPITGSTLQINANLTQESANLLVESLRSQAGK